MASSRRGPLWWLGFALLVVAVSAVGAIVALALQFRAEPAPLWIGLWIVGLLAALAIALRRGLLGGLGLALACLAVFALWWASILPSNDRDWQPDVAELLTATRDPDDPDRITLHNLRNFRWITPAEFEPRWESRNYDLDTLVATDLVLTYWAGPAIAHTIVSFGFADGEHVAFSVGIRPEKGEASSSIRGFFKSYELSVTAADERDVIGLRTSVQQGNRVHLYRIAMPSEQARALFEEYAALADDLAERPRFYRTILANCTTVIWRLVRRLDAGLPFDRRLLLPGYLPSLLYEWRALDMRYTLQELEAMSRLPADVPTDLDTRAYSAAIRAGIPPL
jgi:hypothetical protein